MKSTGIIRRIDDLGRVAIPKEIRRTLNIREGDPLELYVENNGICFKRYFPSDAYIEIISSVIRNIGTDSEYIVNGVDVQQKLHEAIRLLKHEGIE